MFNRLVIVAALVLAGCVKPNWIYEYRGEVTFEFNGKEYRAAERFARPGNSDEPWDFDQWVVFDGDREIDCGTSFEGCALTLAYLERKERDKRSFLNADVIGAPDPSERVIPATEGMPAAPTAPTVTSPLPAATPPTTPTAPSSDSDSGPGSDSGSGSDSILDL